MRISDWSSDVCSSVLLDRRRTASLRSIEPARHRLKNPFTMSKCRWAGPKPCQNPSEDGNLCLHIWKIADGFRRQATQNGGAYRDRPADPLLAKQVLPTLSSGPQPCSSSPGWWAGAELNIRPHTYQACAPPT